MKSHALTLGISACVGEVMARAGDMGAPVALAVVDEGGHVVSFLRSFETKLIACTTATGKARCAVLFGRDSAETEAKARGNPVVFQSFVAASEMPFVIGGGGYLVEHNGLRLGLGVAGATAELDELVGEMARTRLARLIGGAAEEASR